MSEGLHFSFYCMATGQTDPNTGQLTERGREVVEESANATLADINFELVLFDGGHAELASATAAAAMLDLRCPRLELPVRGLVGQKDPLRIWRTAEELAVYRRMTVSNFLYRFTREKWRGNRTQAALLGIVTFLWSNRYFRERISQQSEANVLLVMPSPGAEMAVGNPAEIHMLGPGDIVDYSLHLDESGPRFDPRSDQHDAPSVA